MEVTEFGLADLQPRGRYDELFDACPRAFIQQSTYWAEVIKDLGPDRPIFLLCRDRDEDIAGLPLYLYEHSLGNILTSVPQPGPLGGIFAREHLTVARKSDAYRCLLEAALAIAHRHECMALTLISNPFSNDLDLYERYLSPTFVLENVTQYIALDQPTRRSHGHRNNLNRARKAGYSVGVCQTNEELCDWHLIHRERHGELGVAPLSFGLFENVFRLLVPRCKAQLILVRSPDSIVSGGLYLYHRHITDVFMLSTASKHLENGASVLNTDYSIRWARELGARIYNWQSSPSRESGVYSYKKQWGSIEAVYYFVTKLFWEPEKIQKMGLETIKAQYPWHYVVPYAAFEQGFDEKYFRKM